MSGQGGDAVPTLEHPRERYAVISLSDGCGVVLDLLTGAYFKLNGTALIVCEALTKASSPDEVVEHVETKIRIGTEEARALVALVLRDLARPVPRDLPSGSLGYVRHSDQSWLLTENGRPIFAILDNERRLEFRSELGALSTPLVFYLQALVPKLLALLDVPILHASACRIGSRHIAFSGKSGAGKTTTARAFAQAGADLLAEDLLILTFPDSHVSFRMYGERTARDWARQVASEIEEAPNRPINYSVLTDADQGEVAYLDSLWFIAAQRRGPNLQMHALAVSDGTLAILGNGFLASSYPRHWREFLSRARRIAEAVKSFEATMPAGILRLEEAALSYMTNSAS